MAASVAGKAEDIRTRQHQQRGNEAQGLDQEDQAVTEAGRETQRQQKQVAQHPADQRAQSLEDDNRETPQAQVGPGMPVGRHDGHEAEAAKGIDAEAAAEDEQRQLDKMALAESAGGGQQGQPGGHHRQAGNSDGGLALR